MPKSSAIDREITKLIEEMGLLQRIIDRLEAMRATPKPRTRKPRTVGHFDAVPPPPKAKRGRPKKVDETGPQL